MIKTTKFHLWQLLLNIFGFWGKNGSHFFFVFRSKDHENVRAINTQEFKVGLSPSKTKCVICLIESPLKIMKNGFYFILKALSVIKIFKFLSQLFGHVGKTVWLERLGQLQNSWRHNLVYKQLHYSYCPISHKVKTTRQWNLVN